MPELTISLPAQLVETLNADALPLPVDEYCRRSLEEAVARRSEARAIAQAHVVEVRRALRKAVVDDQPAQNRKLHTIDEAAALLRVSRKTLTKAIDDGRLPVIELSPRARFVEDSVIDDIFRTAQAGFTPEEFINGLGLSTLKRLSEARRVARP